jgi:hypothetical protein
VCLPKTEKERATPTWLMLQEEWSPGEQFKVLADGFAPFAIPAVGAHDLRAREEFNVVCRKLSDQRIAADPLKVPFQLLALPSIRAAIERTAPTHPTRTRWCESTASVGYPARRRRRVDERPMHPGDSEEEFDVGILLATERPTKVGKQAVALLAVLARSKGGDPRE